MSKYASAFALVCFCFAAQPVSAQYNLSLGSVAINPGQTVSIPLSLTATASTLASVEWTLNYDSRIFTAASFTPGAALGTATKRLDCHRIIPGRIVCLASEKNTRTILTGVIANLSLTAATNAAIGNTLLTMTDVVGASTIANHMAVGATTGTVTVRAASAVLTNLTCSLTTLKPSGPATTCTVTLSGPAPAAGLPISIGTTIVGQVILTATPTLTIKPGVTTGTFTLAVRPLNPAPVNGSVVLTVTANGVSRSVTLLIKS